MTLLNINEPVIIPPERYDPLIEEDATASQRFYFMLQTMAERIPIYGTGDPNGQFEANQGRLYVDTNGAQGSRVYMKTTNGGATGWDVI